MGCPLMADPKMTGWGQEAASALPVSPKLQSGSLGAKVDPAGPDPCGHSEELHTPPQGVLLPRVFMEGPEPRSPCQSRPSSLCTTEGGAAQEWESE